MNILVILIIVLLLCGAGGYAYGGPYVGGAGIAGVIVLLIVLRLLGII